MGIRALGFRDLHYLVSVAALGSISRAAQACAITQPALSERVRRIESSLGVELFERNKRRLVVTPIGRRLVQKARELLDEAGEIDEMLAGAGELLSGPLRVGVIATLGPYLVPLILPRLRRDYPALELVLTEGLTEFLLESLLAGSLDVVVAAAPLAATGIRQRELFYEPFVLAVPVDHGLARRKEIHARDLCGDDMVLLEDGHCLAGQALDVCPARRRTNRHRLHAMTLETLRHMVAAGSGYTLLPSLAVGRRPPLEKLIRYTALSNKRRYGRNIVMAWRQTYGGEADLHALAQVIIDCLPAEVRGG